MLSYGVYDNIIGDQIKRFLLYVKMFNSASWKVSLIIITSINHENSVDCLKKFIRVTSWWNYKKKTHNSY
jgi:hypothetical protein